MFKVSWSNDLLENSGGAAFHTEIEATSWIEDCINNKYWGNPDRWLLETDGSHTNSRIIIDSPEILEHYEMQMQYDINGVETGEIEIVVPAQAEQSHTEYFFPVEYTYEIISDTLDEIKAKKLLEISEASLLEREKEMPSYKAMNYALGIYDDDIAAKADIKAKFELYRNNYYRIKALIDACVTEEEVNGIVFSI